jgi:hypothetical protein
MERASFDASAADQPAEAPMTLVTICDEMTDDQHLRRAIGLAVVGVGETSADHAEAFAISQLVGQLEDRLQERQRQIDEIRAARQQPPPPPPDQYWPAPD